MHCDTDTLSTAWELCARRVDPRQETHTVTKRREWCESLRRITIR